jgi:hypothetical protein
MIAGFAKVLAASADDRRNLFVGAGTRMGSVEQNIEKDFWVCWTLDALFNGIEHGGPRLLFKGGTSLSKGDKVVILHGLRGWWERRNELKGGGQRVSRHYYDVFRLLRSSRGDAFAADVGMGQDCVRHARMFFNRPDFDLATFGPGTFALTPHDGMLAALKTDYTAMAGMIFGEVPELSRIIEAIEGFENRLNR